MNRLIALLLGMTVFMTGCGNGEENGARQDQEMDDSASLTISAAASMTDALDEVQELYEETHDTVLTFNFAGSGKLAQQIQQGAPVDVFISANQEWMDRLEEEELVAVDTRTDVTGNSIVLIAGKDSDLAYDSISDIKVGKLDQIAIGNPESVPAGKYAKQSLQAVDIWDSAEKAVVLAKDVRQVLTYVETGNAEIGFVYHSDALSSDKVQVLTKAEMETHDPIIYPAAVTTDSEQQEAAGEFIEFLQGEEAQAIFEKYGFEKN
ncbi:molybdate ABC transporter substrate-binding protein [Bacillus piscicola]|uniref:molybdate ABC transporter substrate-binding protein n=1 Tax=Bacillus piscicola TaxID=1632684 RepID=UPI001F092BDF|nr:molybdate ABC transporter substrate-binding protein [Bacillus piscicola]